MSKVLESLKKMPSREHILHERIADTYFYRKATKKKINPISKKIKAAALALALPLIVMVSMPLFLTFHNKYIKFLKTELANSKIIKIFADGHINKKILKNFDFRGASKADGKIADKLIVLNSSKKYDWADLSIDFKFPLDLSRRGLLISFKGKIGGERLSLVIKDIDNRSYRFQDIYAGFGWQSKYVSFNDVKMNIDISKIAHLRLEYDYVGESSAKTGSHRDVTIYIKEIKVVKEG